MAFRGHLSGAFNIGRHSGDGLGGGRSTIIIDEEALSSLLARREQLQRTAENQLAGSMREQEHLLRINGRLEEQVALQQKKIDTLSLELSLLRGEGSTTRPAADLDPQGKTSE